MSIQVPPDSTGKVVRTITDSGSQEQQIVVIGDGSSTSNVLGSASTPLRTDTTGTTVQPVSATALPLPAGAATLAKQPALGSAGSASTDVITIQGIAAMTKLLVTPDSVALPANQSVNCAQLAGTATSVSSGTKDAGTLRVVLATDQPALTNKLLVTPDSVALPANQSVNVSQINAVTPLMGNGATGTGSPRVTIASDNTAFSVNAVQSGTWTVQPGNTANTTAWLASQTPATSGGLLIKHLISGASTNATNAKASAGQLYGWCIFNTNAAVRYVKLHNTAGTPTAGSGVVQTIAVPAGGGSNIMSDSGIAFATGIGFTTVTGTADADSAAVGANDLVIDLFYK